MVNLGSGIAHKVQDIISILADYFPGLKVRDIGRKEALEASCADLTKLKHLTGWSPRTEFEHGIQKVIEFEKGKVLHGR
jgi:nucleoside-diphosphate-sugar epimerase